MATSSRRNSSPPGEAATSQKASGPQEAAASQEAAGSEATPSTGQSGLEAEAGGASEGNVFSGEELPEEDREQLKEAASAWGAMYSSSAEQEEGIGEALREDAPEAHFLRALENIEPEAGENAGTSLRRVARILAVIEKPRLFDEMIEDIRQKLLASWKGDEELSYEALPAPLLVEKLGDTNARLTRIARRVEQSALALARSQHAAKEDADEAAEAIREAAGDAGEIQERVDASLEQFQEQLVGGAEERLGELVERTAGELEALREKERERITENSDLWRDATEDFREAAEWIHQSVSRAKELTGRTERAVGRFKSIAENALARIRDLQAGKVKQGLWAFGSGLLVALLFLAYTALSAGAPGLSAAEERRMQIGREVQGALRDSTITDEERDAIEQQFSPKRRARQR